MHGGFKPLIVVEVCGVGTAVKECPNDYNHFLREYAHRETNRAESAIASLLAPWIVA